MTDNIRRTCRHLGSYLFLRVRHCYSLNRSCYIQTYIYLLFIKVSWSFVCCQLCFNLVCFLCWSFTPKKKKKYYHGLKCFQLVHLVVCLLLWVQLKGQTHSNGRTIYLVFISTTTTIQYYHYAPWFVQVSKYDLLQLFDGFAMPFMVDCCCILTGGFAVAVIVGFGFIWFF